MNIGLVFSGGMAQGAYQIRALRALNNFMPLHEIKYISCASIGVLNSYAYATGNNKIHSLRITGDLLVTKKQKRCSQTK